VTLWVSRFTRSPGTGGATLWVKSAGTVARQNDGRRRLVYGTSVTVDSGMAAASSTGVVNDVAHSNHGNGDNELSPAREVRFVKGKKSAVPTRRRCRRVTSRRLRNVNRTDGGKLRGIEICVAVRLTT